MVDRGAALKPPDRTASPGQKAQGVREWEDWGGRTEKKWKISEGSRAARPAHLNRKLAVSMDTIILKFYYEHRT